MSGDLLLKFIDYMAAQGLAPADQSAILADDRRRDYKLAGDGTKKGFYKLKIDGDFGFGFFGDYRQGDHHSWSSSVPGQYSAEERRAFAQRMAAERLRAEEEQATQWALKAKEAQGDLIFLDAADPGHPYLVKKGVKPYGIMGNGKDLIIPMSDKDGIWNYQSIQPDGFKLFQAGARKKGTWFKIPGSDVVCICEGYATGASIHEATGATVYVAFDAGNLVAVAPAVRATHKEARIIICADNDAKTKRRDGTPNNVGMVKSQEAARLIGAEVVYPEFEDGDGTDFNDYHARHGLESTRDRILNPGPTRQGEGEAAGGVVSPPQPGCNVRPPGGDFNWMETLIYTDRGGLAPTSVHNTIKILENADEFSGVFKFNEFKSDIFICECPPWDAEEDFRVRRLENVDLTRCEAYLERAWKMKCGAAKIFSGLAAASNTNRFHPVREYFEQLKWDGVPRLHKWLAYYAGAETQPPEYLARVGTTWLVAGVARVFKPGCKFDHMLVLEGPQNAGKSMLLRVLGTFGRDIEETYYTDAISIQTIEERGSILKLQGNLIIEFPEMAGVRKKDQDELKRWITLQEDEVEVKFQQRTHVLPRQFILAGTYNPVPGMGWLTDPTGGRRFWPVTVGRKVDLAALKQDREQLWAEAVHIYKGGHNLFIDEGDPVYQMIQKEQSDRADDDLWTGAIQNIVDEKKTWATSEILDRIGILVSKQNNRTDKPRIAAIMTKLGWFYGVRHVGDTRIRVWKKKEDEPQQLEIEISNDITF